MNKNKGFPNKMFTMTVSGRQVWLNDFTSLPRNKITITIQSDNYRKVSCRSGCCWMTLASASYSNKSVHGAASDLCINVTNNNYCKWQ